jgi:hypothetical protein
LVGTEGSEGSEGWEGGGLDWFRARRLPFLTRRNYHYEMMHLLPWGILAATIEGSFAAVVLSKTFEGNPFLIATATATPAASHVVNIFWGSLAIGRPKLPMFRLLGSMVSLILATVCITPQNSWGGMLFVVQMLAAQIFMSGVINLRSGLWKLNYPRHIRGRITARLQALRTLTSAMASLLAGWLFDSSPESYRWVYPAVALSGGLAMWIAGGIHPRGERRELTAIERGEGTLSVSAVFSPSRVFSEMRRVFREDKAFFQYCKAQMMMGTANLMTTPVMVVIGTEALNLGYTGNNILLDVIPKVVMLSSIVMWGAILDRTDTVRARVINCYCWLGMAVFGFLGTICLEHGSHFGLGTAAAIALFVVSRFLRGLGIGGGTLIWNIGHLHFAKPHEAELYMGIHVTLTGIRAIVATYIGMFLYSSIGSGVWLVAAGMTGMAIVGFTRLARDQAQASGAADQG